MSIPAEAAAMNHYPTGDTFRAWSEEIAPALVLYVAGEIDLLTAPCFNVRIGELRGRGRTIIVDCSELGHIDMAAIHVLEDCYRRAEQTGERFMMRDEAC